MFWLSVLWGPIAATCFAVPWSQCSLGIHDAFMNSGRHAWMSAHDLLAKFFGAQAVLKIMLHVADVHCATYFLWVIVYMCFADTSKHEGAIKGRTKLSLNMCVDIEPKLHPQ